jgi:hypothetical protein
MPQARDGVDVLGHVNLNVYGANRGIYGEVVTVLDLELDTRGLRLIPTYSRVLVAHSIHELVVTDEIGKKPGDTVDRVAFLAFFEVLRSGCIIVGETLKAGENAIGTILGFDETHQPNHMNIVIGVHQRRTGKQLRFELGTPISLEARGSGPGSASA